jgi:predicted transcriptional regulator
MDVSQSQIVKINRYLHGHVITQLITTAVKLGLFDQLKKGQTEEAQLANFLKIDIQILSRYLRALEGLELIVRNQDGRFDITELGALLCRQGSAYGNAILCGDYYYAAWQELEYTLKTGRSAFQHYHKNNLWEITDKFPEAAAAFSKAMRANSAPVVEELLHAYTFPMNGVIADLGAGDGTLLAGILQRKPHLRGLAIEQKSMVSSLQASLNELGVAGRCEIVCADILLPIKLQADIFILKSVLHNWDDKHALQILHNCALNLRKSDRLLVLERAMDPQHPNKLGMAILDLTMLVLFGSQDREKNQYRKLLEQAKLQITSEFCTPSGIFVVEAGLED